jgi:hypothetical protein
LPAGPVFGPGDCTLLSWLVDPASECFGSRDTGDAKMTTMHWFFLGCFLVAAWFVGLIAWAEAAERKIRRRNVDRLLDQILLETIQEARQRERVSE